MILVAVIVGIIIIFMTSANISDQIAKTSDSNTLQIGRELNSGIIRSYGISDSFPWRDELSGVAFSSSQGQTIVEKVTNAGELRKNFFKLSQKQLERLFLTTIGENHFTICFKPESKYYSSILMAKFSQLGEENRCEKGNCYICLRDGLGN